MINYNHDGEHPNTNIRRQQISCPCIFFCMFPFQITSKMILAAPPPKQLNRTLVANNDLVMGAREIAGNNPKQDPKHWCPLRSPNQPHQISSQIKFQNNFYGTLNCWHRFFWFDLMWISNETPQNIMFCYSKWTRCVRVTKSTHRDCVGPSNFSTARC